MKLIFILALYAPPSSAGWIARACARYLIADDPYQYREVPGAWIVREIERIEIKERWNRATQVELNQLTLLEAELKRRRTGQS